MKARFKLLLGSQPAGQSRSQDRAQGQARRGHPATLRPRESTRARCDCGTVKSRGQNRELPHEGRVRNWASRPVARHRVRNLSGAERGLGQFQFWKLPACIKKKQKKTRQANTAPNNCGIFQMFTLNKLKLLAHAQIAKRYNYTIRKKIIGLIKIINCWYTTGTDSGVQQWATGGGFLAQSGQALCHGTADFLGIR